MSRTYTNTPISVPTIFEELVSQVSANLSTDTDLAISEVYFKHGTRMVIQNALIDDSQNPTDAIKNGKYPLVCLIHQFDEQPLDAVSGEIEVQILICAYSSPYKNSQQRLDDNYTPILNPIYSELRQVISDSPYFFGYNQAFSHTKRDLYHTGKESPEGNDGYYLPDCIDGVLMSGVKLKVNMDPICEPATPNLCLLTPCQYGREAYYENAIKGLTIEGVGSSIIRASVTDFYFVDYSGGLPPPFAPDIDWGDGSPIVAMTLPTPPAIVPFTAQLNAAVLVDGFYIGRISFDDSWVDFYYLVENGVVVKCTSLVELDYDFDLSCSLYPNQPINSTMTYTISKVDTQTNIIVGYTYDVFGVQKFTEVINPAVGTITKTMEYFNNFTATNNYMIAHKVNRGGQSPLQVVFQIKTRCKTQF